MKNYLTLLPLTAALFASCGGNQAPAPAPAPIVTPAAVVNLTGVYKMTIILPGATIEDRVEIIDNNGTLTGNERRVKFNNVLSPLGPWTLNGSRSVDGKKAQWTFYMPGQVVTTVDFDNVGGITGSQNNGSSVTLVKTS
jgi:hypothetical protein